MPAPQRLNQSGFWRPLANTIELSVCGGDAALCQITLTTCLLLLCWVLFLQYCAVRLAASGT